jgi:hypothetical protein
MLALGLLAFGAAEAIEAKSFSEGLLQTSDLPQMREVRDQIGAHRKRLIDGCLAFLRGNRQKKHEEFDGRIHQVLRVLAVLRAEEAVPTLSGGLLTFHSDLPAGIRLRPDSPQAYPAAVALASIGGPQVIRAAIRRLEADKESTPRRLCLWVLEHQLGPENVVVLLRQEAARMHDSDKKRSLLRAATEYSDMHGQALSIPEEAPEPNPTSVQGLDDFSDAEGGAKKTATRSPRELDRGGLSPESVRKPLPEEPLTGHSAHAGSGVRSVSDGNAEQMPAVESADTRAPSVAAVPPRHQVSPPTVGLSWTHVAAAAGVGLIVGAAGAWLLLRRRLNGVRVEGSEVTRGDTG